jgi:hypothetical protein
MTDQEALNREADRLYATYGKPLESEHWGEYVMIAPDGRMVLAATAVDAFINGSAKLGSGNFIFKVGERAVATLR